MTNTGLIVSLLLTTTALAGCGEEPCHPEIEGSANACEFVELSTESVTVGEPERVEWEYDCYTVRIEARGGTEDPEALGDLVFEISRANNLRRTSYCGLDIEPGLVANDWGTADTVARALTARLETADLQGSAVIVVEANLRACMRALGS